MTDFVQSIVVGAGAVGLAIARRLAQSGYEVVVLEAEPTCGAHGSSRNSEVIHAGIYYPPGSLKAKMCVRGKYLLYAYCHRRQVEHRRIGKLIVASEPDEVPQLQRLRDNAKQSGVDDLELLDADAVASREPALNVAAALWSPSTGIVDSHGLMHALLGDAEEAGAMVSWRTPVLGVEIQDTGFWVRTPQTDVQCRILVNAAGLGAQSLSRTMRGLPASTVPPQHFAKGTYASLRGRHPFRHLIYPLPTASHLGVHLTLDRSGQARFGPDLQWVDEIDYDVDDGRVESFYPAIRRYWPALEDGRLQGDYAGVRAKIQAPGEPAADFVLQGPQDHGVPGLIQLYGIESPGLTASLALAEETLSRLGICAP